MAKPRGYTGLPLFFLLRACLLRHQAVNRGLERPAAAASIPVHKHSIRLIWITCTCRNSPSNLGSQGLTESAQLLFRLRSVVSHGGRVWYGHGSVASGRVGGFLARNSVAVASHLLAPQLQRRHRSPGPHRYHVRWIQSVSSRSCVCARPNAGRWGHIRPAPHVEKRQRVPPHCPPRGKHISR